MNLLEEAKGLSLGIVNAKLHDRPEDAALLLQSYMVDASEKGYAQDAAWMMLFTASTNLLVDSLKTRGREQHRSPATLLKEIAHSNVGAPSE